MAALVLLKVPISENSSEFVEVEVDQREVVGVELAADPSGVPHAKYSLTDAIGRSLPVMRAAVQQLRAAGERPDEITVELGLKIGGETGVIFARGTAEATFKLTLTWQHNREHVATESTAVVRPPASADL